MKHDLLPEFEVLYPYTPSILFGVAAIMESAVVVDNIIILLLMYVRMYIFVHLFVVVRLSLQPWEQRQQFFFVR